MCIRDSSNISQVTGKLSKKSYAALAMESSLDGDMLTIKVKLKMGYNYQALKLGLYILEDGLVYDQRNWTSYYQGDPIVDFEHHNVLRKAVTGLLGDQIPSDKVGHDKEFEKLKVGSIVEVYLERIESFKGEIIISREKAKRMVAWKKMEKIFETQEEVTGFVTGKVKGGYVCTVDGLPTFMPSSQIDVRPLKKVDHLMNVPIKVVATRIDKKRGNVCTSRRAVLEKSKNAELKEALKNLKEGDIVCLLYTSDAADE